jgi:hypothetical protein
MASDDITKNANFAGMLYILYIFRKEQPSDHVHYRRLQDCFFAWSHARRVLSAGAATVGSHE